jgi:hypothetical protein
MDRSMHPLDAALRRRRVTAALTRLAVAPERPWHADPWMSEGERGLLVLAAERAVAAAARQGGWRDVRPD